MARLVNIDLPEYWFYNMAMEIRCQQCQRLCRTAEQYVNHTCETKVIRHRLHVESKDKRITG
jgi:hypothetical protein